MLSVFLLVVVYVLFVGTADGRDIDAALVDRTTLEAGGRWDVPTRAISLLLSPFSVSVTVIGLLWFAGKRGRQSDGVRAAVIVFGAALGARALKALFGELDPLSAEDMREFDVGFYPSGHAAVAIALPLAAMIVAHDHRWVLVLAGSAFCSLEALVIIAGPSHHASDVLGGFLLGFALASMITPRAECHALSRRRCEWVSFFPSLAATTAAGVLMVLAGWTATQPRVVLLLTTVGLSAAALLLLLGFARMLDVPKRR